MKIKTLNRLTDALSKENPKALEVHINEFLKDFGKSLADVPNTVVYYFVQNHVALKVLKNKAGRLSLVKWMPFNQYLRDSQRYDNAIVSQAPDEEGDKKKIGGT